MFGKLELLHGYFIRENNEEKGRFSLNVRKKIKQLIVGFNSGDKGWKGSYFLALGDLVLSVDYRCPSAWSCEEPRGIPSELLRHMVPIVMIKRGLEIIGSDLSLCGLLNSTECEVADHVMSRVIGSLLNALERRKAKKKKKSKTSSSSTGLVDLPALSHGLPSQTELPDAASLVVRKRSCTVLTSRDGGSIVFSFPADSSIFSNPCVVALGKSLLFPEDWARYEELRQGLQGAIF
ncbi:hypothetical protein Adt_27613 [Abeliophyllum distichum]|uniref:Ribosomal protein S2 n=1 Tax=Abeliophyllum distichum TaxID=126358 RepID=A0ABD1RU80_9LAMI